MGLREYLAHTECGRVHTPAYYFDADEFEKRVRFVKEEFTDIPLTFSIKANPFLLNNLPEGISHVEVCSPGELAICKAYHIPGSRIIYSGVNKGSDDVGDAVAYGVDIATAESLLHVELEQQAAEQEGIRQKVLLRLTSGNQFGMSEDDILQVLGHLNRYPNLIVHGIHYYSGTQKRKRQIDRDFADLRGALSRFEREAGYVPQLVEMGPGLPADYFDPPYDETEKATLRENKNQILAFAREYPLGIEMGRYLAAPCGTYASRVVDIKNNSDTDYVICDGGIHHLNYYGQTMAMQVPEMDVLQDHAGAQKPYCICGSLCTGADVLVREVDLPELCRGDVLLFHRCGAYSVTESRMLFLSRMMPEIYVYSEDRGMEKLRGPVDSSWINRRDT